MGGTGHRFDAVVSTRPTIPPSGVVLGRSWCVLLLLIDDHTSWSFPRRQLFETSCLPLLIYGDTGVCSTVKARCTPTQACVMHSVKVYGVSGSNRTSVSVFELAGGTMQCSAYPW